MSVQSASRWGLLAQFPAPLRARFARNKLAVAGLLVVVLFFLFCFVGRPPHRHSPGSRPR
ncbi:hypothetical protein [Streptomyces prunicolor]|uniref:hypothetical protein n=1 Tax=Streptomyces prunicolor TaxID=67348 RepID=UPI0033C002E6